MDVALLRDPRDVLVGVLEHEAEPVQLEEGQVGLRQRQVAVEVRHRRVPVQKPGPAPDGERDYLRHGGVVTELGPRLEAFPFPEPVH